MNQAHLRRSSSSSIGHSHQGYPISPTTRRFSLSLIRCRTADAAARSWESLGVGGREGGGREEEGGERERERERERPFMRTRTGWTQFLLMVPTELLLVGPSRPLAPTSLHPCHFSFIGSSLSTIGRIGSLTARFIFYPSQSCHSIQTLTTMPSCVPHSGAAAQTD